MALMPRIDLAPELAPGVVELHESGGELRVRARSLATLHALLRALRRVEPPPASTALRAAESPTDADVWAAAGQVLAAREGIERALRDVWPLLAPAARGHLDACIEAWAHHEEAVIGLGIVLARHGVGCEHFLDVAHISEHTLEALAAGQITAADLVAIRHSA